jgi:hypothetical protein
MEVVSSINHTLLSSGSLNRALTDFLPQVDDMLLQGSTCTFCEDAQRKISMQAAVRTVGFPVPSA